MEGFGEKRDLTERLAMTFSVGSFTVSPHSAVFCKNAPHWAWMVVHEMALNMECR